MILKEFANFNGLEFFMSMLHVRGVVGFSAQLLNAAVEPSSDVGFWDSHLAPSGPEVG